MYFAILYKLIFKILYQQSHKDPNPIFIDEKYALDYSNIFFKNK